MTTRAPQSRPVNVAPPAPSPPPPPKRDVASLIKLLVAKETVIAEQASRIMHLENYISQLHAGTLPEQVNVKQHDQ